MRQYETKALVISEMPMKDNDKRVVLFTKDFGKITTFIKGARKPKSKYLTTTQTFAYSDIIYSERKNFINIQHMELIDFFHDIRKDIESVAYGMYMMELLDFVALEKEPQPELLLLTLKGLKYLEKQVVSPKLVRIVYELKLLSLCGFAPELRGCARCGKEEGPFAFSIGLGGLVCPNCNKAKERILHDATLYAMRYIVYTDVNEVFRFNLHPEVLEELAKLCEDYITYHLDKTFKSLEMIKDFD